MCIRDRYQRRVHGVSKFLLSNQNFSIMKKFGIIVVLAMFAIGVSAQELNHPQPILKGNAATLNQEGWRQWGFIFQFGDGNQATINQGAIEPSLTSEKSGHHGSPTGSYGNTAFITQIGFNNVGTINQTGHDNYANLMQLNWGWYHGDQYADIVNNNHSPKPGAVGTITQTGDHNIASVLQLSGSNVNILQGGKHNYIGGSMGYVSCCTNLQQYTYEQSCCPNFMFTPLIIGENQTWDAASINQTGEGEFFFGVGVLKGTRTITQGNDGTWSHNNFDKGHHMKLDNNAIWLSQEGGNAVLTQNGRYNKILLDMDVLRGDPNGPTVEITQNGYKNYVAKFNGPCTLR
eukprot:TRINITY_DN4186_c0_g1_i1.p1 TRINITY_DN4186_c0_g1~~TRINITY_DN4186_c0_g1_i1.p1  ORF type:complete len:346 (+),score=29.86 TRINITY_DN4186_c0_g1_i1:189-1226(+)